MDCLFIHPLEAHNSKGEITWIPDSQIVNLSDIQQRDYVSVKFKYDGKSYWSFRDDLLMAIHGDHDRDICSTVAFPGFTVYLYKERRLATVLRVKDTKVILDDLSDIELDSLDYGVVNVPTVELPEGRQFVLKNDVHAYHKSRIVREDELEKFKKFLDRYDTIAFDSETTGLLQDLYKLDDPEDFLVSISLSVDANSGYYIRASKSQSFRDFIRYVCTKHLIVHNAAFDLGMLNGVYGLEPISFDDTLIMSKLLNENLLSYGLKTLSTQILGRGKQLKLDDFDYLGYLRAGKFDKIEYILAYYAAADTANTYGLYQYIWPKLQTDEQLTEYYRSVELASIMPVSVAISQNGLTVDTEALAKLKSEVELHIEAMMNEMKHITSSFISEMNVDYLEEQRKAREEYWQEVYLDFSTRGLFKDQIEIDTTKQIIDTIEHDTLPPYASCKKLATYHNRLAAKPTGNKQYTFDLSDKKFMELLVYTSSHGFGLPPQKSKAGNYSLGKPAISEIEKHLHAQVTSGNLRLQQVQKFFECFKEYTKSRKLLDAFITPTLAGIGDFKDGKIHPSYNLLGTVSSRASCSSPNLQQLANNKKFDLRKCFIVEDREKYSFLQFDLIRGQLKLCELLGTPMRTISSHDLECETLVL